MHNYKKISMQFNWKWLMISIDMHDFYENIICSLLLKGIMSGI